MKHLTRRGFLVGGTAVSVAAANREVFSAFGEPREVADSTQPYDSSPRERLLLDFNWRFHLGHAADPAKDFGFGAMDRESTFAKSGYPGEVTRLGFDDKEWAAIDLPHDWAIELPFVKEPADVVHHGGKPLGREFPATSIGWYRRKFDLPSSDTGKRLAVEFDGVFRNAMIFFNGHYLGVNFSGYSPCRFDLTDIANCGGSNILTVRVDATLAEGWFYEGAGIYRHVWLTKTDPLHLMQWGTFVRSTLDGHDALLTIQSDVANDGERPALCRVVSRVVAPDASSVALATSEPFTIPAHGFHKFETHAKVAQALLWSLENRNLYRLISTIEKDGRPVDHDEVTFGVRSIKFDPDHGFFLNGKPIKIKGTCNHQDHAGVGAALPDRLQSYRIERLKEMGSNGYRTSHNPPTPELLDACDHLGMLVMDETRMMSSSPEGLSQLERMVRRDRNHPCIVLWSLGNEEPEQGNERGARIVADMKRLVYQLDGTRPVTMAMNDSWGKGVSAVVDVQGFNYGGGGGHGGRDTAIRIDEFHRQFPRLPMIGSETASEYMTRGIYQTDKDRGYISAYDVNFPNYTLSAEGWWDIYDRRPFLSGAFAWTGFDYRGEPSPFEWPCVSSHFGAMDNCGFPKDTFYFYKSAWVDEPVLHLFPHWNWSGAEGTVIDVWVYTNLESVELLLNGRSLGSQAVQRNTHLSWKVPYVPGVLEARASKAGKVVLTAKRETTGPAAKVVLRSDRQTIAADAEDVSVVVVEIQDAQGRVVPTAGNDVHFNVVGPGRLLGVGNGDPSSHESDKANQRRAFNGLCAAFVQSLRNEGTIEVNAASDGLESGSAAIQAVAAKPRPFVG